MKYSIIINQPRAIKWGLNLSEASVFAFLYNAPSWADSLTIDGEVWYFISRTKAVEEMPLISDKADTFYRHYKSLVNINLVMWRKIDGKDYVRLTEKAKLWEQHENGNSEKFPSDGSSKKENPSDGKISENDSEKNPTYKRTSIDKKTRKDSVKSNDSTLPASKNTKPLKAKKKLPKTVPPEQADATDILAYLNEKANRQFLTEGKKAEANLRIIIARLKDGYTAEELKKVIDTKVSQWFDNPDMSKFLKPSTLFIPKHVADYLEESSRNTNATSGGLHYDINLNGSTEKYEKWWEKLQSDFPNVANEIRFFKASEFMKFIAPEPEWYPMIHASISGELYKKHIRTALAQLESDSNRKRTAQGGLYSYLTGFLTQKAKE